MRSPSPLPEPLVDAGVFGIETARRLGVTRGRSAGPGLTTPRRGVRLVEGATPTLWARAAAFAERMPPHQCLSHFTPALLHGVPLPLQIERDPRLHLAVIGDGALPRGRGVVGHRIDPTRARVVEVRGIRMTDAATTWCQLAASLSLDDLVAAGDFLVTGRKPVGGPVGPATVAALTAATERHRGTRGASAMREALPLIRFGALSRRESLLRLRIVRAGLPEPSLNHRARECLVDGAHPVLDLSYPEWLVATEYEGDHHRDPDQFRRDLRRIELLQDAGWLIVRATACDVPDDPSSPVAEALIARIRHRLTSRGWTPT